MPCRRFERPQNCVEASMSKCLAPQCSWLAATMRRTALFYVPRRYIVAADIFKKVSTEGGRMNFATLLYDDELRHFRTNVLYALITETIKNSANIDKIFENCSLVANEPDLDLWLAKVLTAELLFGKKALPGKSKPEITILSYKDQFVKYIAEHQEDYKTELETKSDLSTECAGDGDETDADEPKITSENTAKTEIVLRKEILKNPVEAASNETAEIEESWKEKRYKPKMEDMFEGNIDNSVESSKKKKNKKRDKDVVQDSEDSGSIVEKEKAKSKLIEVSSEGSEKVIKRKKKKVRGDKVEAKESRPVLAVADADVEEVPKKKNKRKLESKSDLGKECAGDGDKTNVDKSKITLENAPKIEIVLQKKRRKNPVEADTNKSAEVEENGRKKKKKLNKEDSLEVNIDNLVENTKKRKKKKRDTDFLLYSKDNRSKVEKEKATSKLLEVPSKGGKEVVKKKKKKVRDDKVEANDSSRVFAESLLN